MKQNQPIKYDSKFMKMLSPQNKYHYLKDLRENYQQKLENSIMGKFKTMVKYYTPIMEEKPIPLDNYQGKYSKQADFIYMLNMIKMEKQRRDQKDSQ